MASFGALLGDDIQESKLTWIWEWTYGLSYRHAFFVPLNRVLMAAFKRGFTFLISSTA